MTLDEKIRADFKRSEEAEAKKKSYTKSAEPLDGIKLYNCPYCKSKGSPKIWKVNPVYGSGYRVRCDECWAITEIADTRKKAAKLWNDKQFSEATTRLNAFHEARKSDTDVLDADGVNNLTERILSDVAEEYIALLRLSRKGHDNAGQRRVLENFILNGALMKGVPVDGQEVIKILRKKAGYSE